MIKRATIYSDPDDPGCASIEKLLNEEDVILKVHDIKAKPLDYKRLSELLRHFNLEHFYKNSSNGNSGRSGRGKTANMEMSRQEILQQIADDNSLLKLPIVVSGRLMTVGDNFERIKIMLQIKDNNSTPEEIEQPEINE